jgi:hypothetical protein
LGKHNKGEKMKIKHILKNGTVLEDIKGHLVKKEDALVVYQIREQMNNRRKEKEDGNHI